MGRPRNILLALLVLVCAVSIWLGQGRPWPTLPGAPESRSLESGSPPAPAAEPIHLRVLNGTEESGLAGDVALLVPRLGCVVESVGNAAPWPAGPSVLINRRLPAAEARDLADRLGGLPVLREWDGRTTEDAVLVLGSDFEELQTLLKGKLR